MEFEGKEILMRFRHDYEYSLEDAYEDFLNLFSVSNCGCIKTEKGIKMCSSCIKRTFAKDYD